MSTIRIPTRGVALPGGLRCAPGEVRVAAWQAHLLKHPLGIGAVRNERPWNHEAWDVTTPPVVTQEQRERLSGRIVALDPGGDRCQVRELRGARSPEAEPCYRCQPSLLQQCAVLLDEADGVGRRYAAVIDALLGEVAEDRAMVVPRPQVFGRLFRGLTRPAWIEAGIVVAVGVEGRSLAPTVRIARGDGTRADFWLNGTELVWRTTYRLPQVSVNTRASFLMDHPAPSPSLSLSDVYVVPRGWWEAHGN